LLLVAGLVVGRVADEPYVAPRPEGDSVTASAGEASSALRILERAVQRRDVAAARELAASDDPRTARLLAAMVGNADDADLVDVTLRYVDELGAVAAGGWDAAVEVTWAFDGFDPRPARAEVRFRFEASGDGVSIAGVGGDGSRTPLWMTGPLEVRRAGDHLVLVDGSEAQADRLAAQAAIAVPAVRRVLPDWAGGLVVEVPATVADLHAALDGDPGTYDEIAAVTTTVDGSTEAGAPVHVFVNPDVYGSLQERGAQVVMTHEAVHVATDAATSTTPLWLLEGFADYVALRDVPLPLDVTAAQILRQVRRDGPPAALPGSDEFDTTTAHLGASYEAAWLACRLLADLGGERALLRFYRLVQEGASVDDGLREAFGFGEAELTRRWRDLLTDLAA
jgi:hypothetical protein